MATPVSDVVTRLRNEVLRDSAEPYLFSTDEIINVLSEGYRIFARHTHAIINTFTVRTVVGQSSYTLDPTVCYVRQVTLVDASNNSVWYLTPYTRRAKPLRWTGRPTAYSTDAAQSTLKLYPVPDQAYTLEVDCAVVPERLTANSTIALGSEWIPTLMNYASARLLSNNDPDGSNQVAAQQFEQRWKEGVMLAKQQFIRDRVGEGTTAMPRRWT